MTDNEIIKALEYCVTHKDTCENCPCVIHQTKCATNDPQIALDLINRQKAEIERLKEQLNSKYQWENMLDKKIKEVKTEAIKELVERFETEFTPTVIAMAIIGEILVAVSKSHISAESAIDKIREQMSNTICTRYKLQQIKDNIVKEVLNDNC